MTAEREADGEQEEFARKFLARWGEWCDDSDAALDLAARDQERDARRDAERDEKLRLLIKAYEFSFRDGDDHPFTQGVRHALAGFRALLPPTAQPEPKGDDEEG